jgi:hypothetical protein
MTWRKHFERKHASDNPELELVRTAEWKNKKKPDDEGNQLGRYEDWQSQ